MTNQQFLFKNSPLTIHPIYSTTIVGIIIIVGFTCYLQSILLLNTDVAVHLNVADRMRKGALLYEDIILLNLPLQFYFRWPLLNIAEQFEWSSIVIIAIFHMALSCISLAIVSFFYWRVLPKQQAAFLTIMSAFVLLLLPSVGMPWDVRKNEMGQKEHLIIIFLLPYITSLYLRAIKHHIPVSLAIIIGMGGAMICWLKPHYALVILLCEVWLLYKVRSFWAVIRPETMSMVVSAIALLAIFWDDMVRYVAILGKLAPLYISDSSVTFVQAAWRAPVYAVPFIVIFIAYCLSKLKHSLIRYYTALLIGCLICSVLQGKGFGYYFLPAVSFGFLLTAIFIWVLVSSGMRHHPMVTSVLFVVVSWLALLYGPHIPLQQGNGLMLHKHATNELKQIVNTYANDNKVLILSSNIDFPFPLVNYMDLDWEYNFYHLWPVMGFEVKKWHAKPNERQALEQTYKDTMQWFKHQTATYLMESKPSLILVGLGENGRFRGKHFVDYIAFFSTHTSFAKEMKHYQHIDTVTIMGDKGPRFAVYVRQ